MHYWMKSWSRNDLGKKHKLLEFNENESPKYLNLWDTRKAFLRDKCIALSYYIKKDRSHLSNSLLHLKDLNKKEKIYDKEIDSEK